MAKLLVVNLPDSIDESAVRALFKLNGALDSIALKNEPAEERPRGFGFVEMASADAARAMQSLNGGTLHDGRSLRFNEWAGFADRFRSSDGPIIDPERFMNSLHIGVQELAALSGVHRSTISETPSNARLQNHLRDSVRVLSAAMELSQDEAKAIYWFRNAPIAEFEHETAENLVKAGKTDAVLSYLTSIASGSTG